MIQIAPSILSADFVHLFDEIQALSLAGADLLHVDVMDGHFVPNLTIGPPVIAAIRKITKLSLDVHLMIESPEKWIEIYANAGADCIYVHAEACVHLHRVLEQIRQMGKQVGVVLNPASPLSMIEHVLHLVDKVLIMTVNPGFGGQKFIFEVLPKISTLFQKIQAKKLLAKIVVDGGINIQTAPLVIEAGATMLVAGSAIFSTKNYKKAIESLRTSRYK